MVRDIEKLPLEQKIIKSAGRSIRIIPNNDLELSSPRFFIINLLKDGLRTNNVDDVRP